MDLPALYARMILTIGTETGLDDGLLHVHAGMAIFLVARLVTGRPLSTPVPLAIVALAEAVNEVIDRLHYGSWRPADTISDIVNTLFWPTILFFFLSRRGMRAWWRLLPWHRLSAPAQRGSGAEG